jgi:tyrosyl-tRNA synthetase
MGLVHLQRAGHRPIVLVGGGTGLIGDPSGKSAERNLLSREEARANGESFRDQLRPFLDFEGVSNRAVMVNNLDWLDGLQAIDFMRDIGKHFSVNAMLRKDSVRSRLEGEGDGISYTEFSYLLLQAYDFLALSRDHGCRVQIGGSDQWGNITAGIDLIRRVTGERAYGVVFPLLTTSSGAKFGKSESGAVWLDPARTSPFRFYQFWVNTEDADVGRLLRLFTVLPIEEIEGLDEAARSAPEGREAQARLAEDVTLRVHGQDGLDRARRASQALFGGELVGLSAREIEEIFADVPSSGLEAARLGGEGVDLVTLVAEAGVTTSKGEARRAIEQGGVYLNGVRAADPLQRITRTETLHGRFLVLRRGKKTHHLVRIQG